MHGRVLVVTFAAFVLVASPALLSAPFAKAETSTVTGSSGLSDADVAAIKENFKKTTAALIAGDLKVWSEGWAEGAVLMPPDHPSVAGIPRLLEFVRGNLSNLKTFTQSDWTFEGRGNLAVVTTHLEWTFKDGAAAQKGKQVVVLLKDGDGVWKAQKVLYNTDGGS